MDILDDKALRVERAVFEGAVKSGGRVLVRGGDCAAVTSDFGTKCVLRDGGRAAEYAAELKLTGSVCFMNMTEPPVIPGARVYSEPYRAHAYLAAMPPEPAAVKVRRLAPSLAPTVLAAYDNAPGYTESDIAGLMKRGSVFGCIADGKLAGFIGLHFDGSMGMLHVFEPFRRRGIGEGLERFLITYVMTFGRTPVCDIALSNPASAALQSKLGLSAAAGLSYWAEL